MNKCYINTFRNNFIVSSPPASLLAPKIIVQNVINRGAHEQKKNIRSTLNYMIALGVMTVGLSYAAVPLYRIFCQVSGVIIITLFSYKNNNCQLICIQVTLIIYNPINEA